MKLYLRSIFPLVCPLKGCAEATDTESNDWHFKSLWFSSEWNKLFFLWEYIVFCDQFLIWFWVLSIEVVSHPKSMQWSHTSHKKLLNCHENLTVFYMEFNLIKFWPCLMQRFWKSNLNSDWLPWNVPDIQPINFQYLSTNLLKEK